MSLLFTPLHFEKMHSSRLMASSIANEVFQKWIGTQLKVGATRKNDVWIATELLVGRTLNHETHKGYLVCLEELPKKECEHYPSEDRADHSKCKFCGTWLELTWKARK